jgi:hypothetical protein
MAIGYWDSANARIEAGSAYPILITSYQGNIKLGISGGTTMTVQDGKVGIGTTAPSQALHVVGNVYVDDDNTTGGGIILGTGDRPLITRGWDPFTSGNKNGIGRWGVYMEAAELFLASPGTDYTNGLVTIGGWLLDGTRQPNLTVNNYTRNVGIGTTAPAYLLDVSGTIRATGDVIAYSDARVKDNVETIKDALQTIISLRGVTYTRNDSEDKSRKVGVIAQEVLSVLPEVVQQDIEGNYSVAYGNMVGVLIEAIKELTARIEQLENK